MADTVIGVSQIVTLNDKNANDYGCSDLFNDAPLITALSTTVATNGTQHKYIKETGAANVGFRTPYHGIDHGMPTNSLVTIDLKILEASNYVDKAVADSYTKGGADAMIARVLKQKLKQAMFIAEKALLNGDQTDGFSGLAQGVDSSMTIDAGGTAGSTSSIYLLRTNDDGCDVQFVVGNDGNIRVDETVTTMKIDENGKAYPVYYTPVGGWAGLQVGSKNSVARVKKLDNSTHKLTDALIYQALALFPASRQPNLIAMSRRDLANLQASRTATNATGAPAPRPTEVDGIRIVVTDALSVTE